VVIFRVNLIRKGGDMIKKLGLGVILFSTLFFIVVSTAVAQEAEAGDSPLAKFGLAIASGIGLAIAAFAGALGQGRTAAAALEGIARNPEAADRMFVPMILGLALIESLVLYAFVIAFLLQLKI
jgi:F-type H+-transporting ATPase subunit c